MPSDLSAYLATHYLTADPKPSSKKRKRKQDPSAGLLITDDGETGWKSGNADDEDEENTAATVAGTSAEFRKAKKSAWKVVGAPAPSESSLAAATDQTQQPRGNDTTTDADAILASAAAEDAARAAAAEDAERPAVTMMSDGTHAGLQSAATVSAQLARRKAAEEAEFARMRRDAAEAETVYRDATGRRVDAGMKRAEARRQAAEAAARAERERESLRGEVQVREARERRERLEDARLMGVARGADDEDLNRELKAQTRWGDTMAEFIGGGGGGGNAGAAAGKSGKKKGKGKGRPVYQGAAPPNRYGIKPGYRWDGVDRGNGYEAERFKAINRVERNKDLEYNWLMDE